MTNQNTHIGGGNVQNMPLTLGSGATFVKNFTFSDPGKYNVTAKFCRFRIRESGSENESDFTITSNSASITRNIGNNSFDFTIDATAADESGNGKWATFADVAVNPNLNYAIDFYEDAAKTEIRLQGNLENAAKEGFIDIPGSISGNITFPQADVTIEVSAPSAGGGSPLTTKGDLFTHNGTADARLATGTEAQILSIDTAEATGLKWIDGGGGGMPSFTHVEAPGSGTTQLQPFTHLYVRGSQGAAVTFVFPGTAESVADGHQIRMTVGGGVTTALQLTLDIGDVAFFIVHPVTGARITGNIALNDIVTNNSFTWEYVEGIDIAGFGTWVLINRSRTQ